MYQWFPRQSCTEEVFLMCATWQWLDDPFPYNNRLMLSVQRWWCFHWSQKADRAQQRWRWRCVDVVLEPIKLTNKRVDENEILWYNLFLFKTKSMDVKCQWSLCSVSDVSSSYSLSLSLSLFTLSIVWNSVISVTFQLNTAVSLWIKAWDAICSRAIVRIRSHEWGSIGFKKPHCLQARSDLIPVQHRVDPCFIGVFLFYFYFFNVHLLGKVVQNLLCGHFTSLQHKPTVCILKLT